MAFKTIDLLTLVEQSITTKWPSGVENMIMKSLSYEYKPKDEVSRVELVMELQQVRMKNGNDPRVMFS